MTFITAPGGLIVLNKYGGRRRGDAAVQVKRESGGAPAAEQNVRRSLKKVIDPELGLNVVDLGLIYGIEAGGSHARIVMTMTTPGCPALGYLKDAVARAAAETPGIDGVTVEIVWSPPWSPDMMTEEGRRFFGRGSDKR